MTKIVTQTLHFDKSGGTLTVRMTAGNAAPGHYMLRLLEHDGFTVVKDFGVVKFGSVANNTHALPSPASANDGRILQAVTSVGIVDANREYAVFMDLKQDGKTVGTITDHGPDTNGTADTVESELDGALSGSAAVLLNTSVAALIAPSRRARAGAQAKRTKERASLKARTTRLMKDGSSTNKPAKGKKGGGS